MYQRIAFLGRSFKLHHGYHLICYEAFAVSKSTNNSSRTSVLPPECIFCGERRRKLNAKCYKLGKAEKSNPWINIRNAAKGLDDQELFKTIGTYDFRFGTYFPAMGAVIWILSWMSPKRRRQQM